MECNRCGNKDPTYFYKGHKGYYCRKCIGFSRILQKEKLEPIEYDVCKDASDYVFNYELTPQQVSASNRCANYIKDNDVLLHCVCGAGKTEIVVKSISQYLADGKKVAYAISRREVVIELTERFKNIFKNCNVTSLYGGHHDNMTGDLIVCTTHQLYRYHKTFDLLILDEVDAYPLKGNSVLMNIAINSCKGHIIYSTATIDDGLMKIIDTRKYSKVELFTRPSNAPLIIPKLRYFPLLISIIYLFYLFANMDNQCIVFVTSKRMCELLHAIYKHFYACTYVYSDLDNRDNNIRAFKNKEYKFIFATSVLERGITIKDVNVIIINNDKIFDEANLIQMLGRVGRSINNPYGQAYILSNHIDKNIDYTLSYLRRANSYL